MKKLILVRHSIAQEPEEVDNDLLRKLTNEGIERAKKVVSVISDELFKDSVFISSPALRALETAKIFLAEKKIPENLILQHEFVYSCYKENSFFYFLEDILNNKDKCWIFGHNPMMTNIVRMLINNKDFSMPKCGVAIISSSSNTWIDISSENSKMLDFINPKKI